MIITPQLVPHAEFHTGIWLLPVKESKWYYFSQFDNQNQITNEDFLESVDEPLKELVRFLHDKNIRTTPSCAGHSYGKDYFEAIYSDLKKDEEEIKNKGLLLKDIESGAMHLFKDKDYELPWDRNHFVDFAYSYQTKGVVGLRLNQGSRIREKILALKIPKVTITEKDEIVFIHTDQINPQNLWKTVTMLIKEIFEKSEDMTRSI